MHVVSMGPSHHEAHKWENYLADITKAASLEALREKFLAKLAGSARSIDWFLRNNPDYEDIAKLHIAAVLLDREYAPPTGDWYAELSRQVLPTHTKTFESGMLSVITFNYDRSLERFFLTLLESDYNLSPTDAEREFAKVRIEHVYGKLGTLAEVPYGDTSHADSAGRGITLTRATVDEQIRKRIQPLLDSSKYINFIGFGFDEDNLGLFGIDSFKEKRVWATSLGLSVHDRNRAARQVGASFSPKHPDCNALEFLRNLNLFGRKQERTRRPSSYPRPSSVPRP